LILGGDDHPSFQQVALVDTDTGDLRDKRLTHSEAAEKFYRALAATARQVRVGMEGSGRARWFEPLLAELQFELWMGDVSEMRRKREGKQKTIGKAWQHILHLLLKADFLPIWVRTGRIGICGNYYGIDAGWCRRAPGSGINCKP